MRSRVALTLPVLLLLMVASVLPAHAEEEPSYFTLSGGWSWPSGGPIQDTYEPGFIAAAAFRVGVAESYLSGIEFGYGWFSLDSAGLASKNSGSTFSGGDMGLLSITTENDYLFGTPGNPMRPFLNLGLGYYKSFIDDATETNGSTTSDYDTGVYKGSFFGFHAGIGAMLNRERFGLRVDANYEHLFAGGPDLECFTVRAGIVFFTSGVAVGAAPAKSAD